MAEQGRLDIQIQKKLDAIEEYQFEPIKGYPMLHWKGKRPFNSTQNYPAQLKESYGQELNGWMNKIFWGDNLQVMSHMLKDYRGKIDLIYIDPPFDSKADYKKEIKLRGKKVTSNHQAFEEKQYTDIWTNDGYLQFMYERLILLRELLAEHGTIYVHCDHHKVHHLRCIMEEIFGAKNFLNECIWLYSGREMTYTKYNAKHDNIIAFTKNQNINTFNWKDIGLEPAKEVMEQYKHVDEQGRKYVIRNSSGSKGLKEETDDTYRQYYKPVPPRTWFSVPIVSSGNEKIGYPTQKAEKLIERFILASSNPGDIVFDCFMGSGTTQAVAMKTGRKFIGADINLGSIETSSKRLNKVIDEIKNNPPQISFENEREEKVFIKHFYTNFSLYNVNNYDVFRNPVQAKEILKQALEIQPLPNNTIYDGEKDGRMVKIMPVNRIATRADLNELISGFNIKSFEKKFEVSPNKSVESLLLVCMGHEPDLAASLQKEMHPYKLDIEVVDILRDKSNLEFKRDSEAVVVKEGEKLLIKEFYPMNLLQKLSLMKENVEDWKELTESVKVDFNYDGAVFEPQVVDVPEKDELVKGEYAIPEDAGTIRVKITDLLSESLELTIEL